MAVSAGGLGHSTFRITGEILIMETSHLVVYTCSAIIAVQLATTAAILATYGRNLGVRGWAGPIAFGLFAFVYSAGAFVWTSAYYLLPQLAYLQIIAAFLVPPAFFAFAAFISISPAVALRFWPIHLIPAAIAAIIFWGPFAPPDADTARELQAMLPVVWIVLAAQSAVYIALSSWVLVRDIRRLGDIFSYRGSDAENRLKRLIVVFSIVCGLWISDLAADLAFTLSLFDKGILGAIRVFGLTVMCTMTVAPTPLIPRPPYDTDAKEIDAETLEPARYRRSSLAADAASRIAAKVDAVMREEKLHQNSFLTLKDLSEASGVSQHKLAQTLNVHLGKSFFDYVNEWRVAEVQAALEAGSEATFLTLATEAGFNSKSTFNSAFKKFTGKTPSEFRKSVQNASPVGAKASAPN